MREIILKKAIEQAIARVRNSVYRRTFGMSALIALEHCLSAVREFERSASISAFERLNMNAFI